MKLCVFFFQKENSKEVLAWLQSSNPCDSVQNKFTPGNMLIYQGGGLKRWPLSVELDIERGAGGRISNSLLITQSFGRMSTPIQTVLFLFYLIFGMFAWVWCIRKAWSVAEWFWVQMITITSGLLRSWEENHHKTVSPAHIETLCHSPNQFIYTIINHYSHYENHY